MKVNDIQMDVPQEFEQTVAKVMGAQPTFEVNADEQDITYQAQLFSLKALLSEHKVRVFIAFVIVLSLTLAQNVGPVIFSKAVDIGVIGKDFTALAWFALMYFGVVVLSVFLSWLNITYTGKVGQQILYDIRVSVFRHLQSLSADFYATTKAGHIIARMTSDINALSRLLQKVLVNLLVQFLALLIIILVMLMMNPTLAVIVVLSVIPPMVLTTIWFRRVSIVKFTRVRNLKADVITDVRESLYGIKQVMGFHRQTRSIDKHSDILNRFKDANNDTAKSTSLYPAITGVIEVTGQVILFYVGYQLVMDNQLTVGELIAFSLFLSRFFGPIERLTLLFGDFQEGKAAADKITALMAIKPSIDEVENPQQMKDVKGDITFEQVSFAYNPEGEQILNDINLVIKAGQTVSIVGETGAGKSTLIKLVNRLYDPVVGRVLIDGVDIKTMGIASLRSKIGVVQQDPFLFNGTIKENIVFANPDATEAQIEHVCEQACLKEMISQLPQGLDTQCHEKGVSFSAGEKQLIIIARLFLCAPAIVLFDEATSNIDLNTEAKIELALKQLMKDKTAIMISHQIQNTRFADRIVVVADKQIVQSGHYDQLSQQEGVFKTLLRYTQA